MINPPLSLHQPIQLIIETLGQITQTAHMKQARHQLGLHTTITYHNNQKPIHTKLTGLMKITYLHKLMQTNNTPIFRP